MTFSLTMPTLKRRWFLIGILGFFSGLPLALTAGTLTTWLSDAQVTRASIGLFAAIATPYAFKFLWAPLLDGLRLPLLTARLGRRRGWLLITQALLAASIAAMAFTNPALNPWMTALVGVIIASLSATQDTVIDAYRVERLPTEEQGTGAACATFGYRIGMLVSGGGALYLADTLGWHATYLIMACVMGLGVVVTLMMRETFAEEEKAKEMKNTQAFIRDCVLRPLNDFVKLTRWRKPLAIVAIYLCLGVTAEVILSPFFTSYFIDESYSSVARNLYIYIAAFLGVIFIIFNILRHTDTFRDFMTRPMWLHVLAFVILYKLGDAFMGVMFNPFLLDIGFTKTQIAQVVKIYGLFATIFGTFAGGWLVGHIGMYRSLMICGLGHMLTNLLLVVQAQLGADLHFLIFSISLEHFTGGMSTAAFIAYLSALCKLNYTATQYALLSSLAAFGRTWLSTPSGLVAEKAGWEWFFAISCIMALPSLALLWWIERRKNSSPRENG